jgi:CRISPR-associated protein Cmr3
VSGWSFEKETRGPKHSRRAAPAGSVYWLDLHDGVRAEDLVREVWMNCVSDDEQDRLDGFGVAVVGVA